MNYDAKFRINNRRFPVAITETDKRISFKFAYNKQILDHIRGLEGARWNPKTKSWSAVHPNLSPRNAKLLGYLTEGRLGTVPDSPGGLLWHYSTEPSSHHFPTLWSNQNALVNFWLAKRRAFWAADMGLGKSLSAITAINWLFENGHVTSQPWVVAPLSALAAWRYELDKWKPKLWYPRLISCHHATITKHMEQVAEPPQILILDEIAVFKTATSQRSRLIMELSRLMYEKYQGNEYVVGMTGTPAPKDPTDWWTSMEIVCPGFIAEKNPKKLLERLAETEKREGIYGGVYTERVRWKLDEVEKFYQRLKPAVIIQFKKDHLDLPDKLYTELEAAPSEDILSAARIIIENSDSTIQTLSRLRQLSDGFQYRESEEGRQVDYIETPKDDLLRDLLDQHYEYRRLIVYAGFKASVWKCRDICLKKGWNVIQVDGDGWQRYAVDPESFVPDPTQAQFLDDDLDQPIVFVGSADAASTGLTLTSSPSIVYYSNTFNAMNRWQSEDRIWRPGCKGANIFDLIHLPTDRDVLKNLRQKRELQNITMGHIASQFERMMING